MHAAVTPESHHRGVPCGPPAHNRNLSRRRIDDDSAQAAQHRQQQVGLQAKGQRIAAAKFYVAASKKTGLRVPDSVKQLADRAC
jgi:hypothetical protein